MSGRVFGIGATGTSGAMDQYLEVALVVLLIWGAWFWVKYRTSKSKSKRYRLPPGPRPWPVVGNLPSLAKSRRLEEAFGSLSNEYGPIVWLKLGSGRGVLLSSRELAREVLKEQDALFSSRPRPQRAAREMLYIGDELSYAPCGPFWKFSRKLFATELMTQNRLQHFKAIRDAEADAMVESIRHLSLQQSEQERSIDIQLFLHCVILNSMSRISVGTRFFVMPGEIPGDSCTYPKAVEGADELYSMRNLIKLLTSSGLIGDTIPSLSFLDAIFNQEHIKSIRDTGAKADAFLQRVLDEHRLHLQLNPDETEPRDILEVLLSIPDTSGDGPPVALSDRRLKSLCLGMIVAGADLAPSAVEWALAELIRHPEHMKTAQEELERVVGNGRDVDETDLPHLPFLRAVVKESWRLHPFSAILFPRVSTEDTMLGGYDIPANTTVLINVYGITHNPALWPEPHRFVPQRFLDRPDIDVRGKHFELMPFGAGRRACPGMSLGLMLVEVNLAKLLHNFDWCLPGQLKSRPQDLCMDVLDGRIAWRRHPLVAVPSSRRRGC